MASLRYGSEIPSLAERIAAVGYDPATVEQEQAEECDLCGGRLFVQIARQDRYGFAVCSQLCRRCGLVFLDPRPTPAAYVDFYARIYRPLVSAYTGSVVTPETLEPQQERYARLLDENVLGREIRRRGLRGRLLDVGGSTGAVAAHFSNRYGFAATVLDPSPSEIERARTRGMEAVVGFAEDFDPGNQRFDLILLCQTVDHLSSISAVLQRIREWLTDDGLFFVDPLDFRAMCRKTGRLSAALKVDHPFALTRETMELYLARAGLSPVAIDASGILTHLGYVCRKTEPSFPVSSPSFADRLYEEIRQLQTSPRLAPSADGGGPLRRLRRWLRRSP